MKRLQRIQSIFHEPSIFNDNDAEALLGRLHTLTASTPGSKTSSAAIDMLVFCNDIYDAVIAGVHDDGLSVAEFHCILEKIIAVGKNELSFPVVSDRYFDDEKRDLIDNIDRVRKLGGTFFASKKIIGDVPLSAGEWSGFFYSPVDVGLDLFGL